MLYWMLTGAIAASGVTMLLLTFVYHSEYGKTHRIRDGSRGSSSAKRFRRYAALNSVLSISLVYGLTWISHPFLFHEEQTSVLHVLAEATGILLLYDFFYYLVHRYPFHEWKLLRRVHAVHHVIRNPSAIDSLYLHPIETTMGLSLLWVCASLLVVVVGPVSVYSFGVAFGVYSLLNVLVHAGLKLERFPFSIVTHLATRHDTHHESMKGKNYASVTPIWDIVFGTETRPDSH